MNTSAGPSHANPGGDSPLDRLIPREISDDAFYRAIVRCASEPSVSSILEIGSSSGEGSTRAFIEGILKNPTGATLYCMEVSEVRCQALRQAYADHPFVKAFNYSSIPAAEFPTPERVRTFCLNNRTNLNHYPVEMVLGWLQADLDYLRVHGKDMDGIARIKVEAGIEAFDLVLIDGSEFAGRAELKRVLGSRIILLDDINAFKNYENYHELRQDPAYTLEEEDWTLRNGYAVFRRKG